jgi:hypothetical protein
MAVTKTIFWKRSNVIVPLQCIARNNPGQPKVGIVAYAPRHLGWNLSTKCLYNLRQREVLVELLADANFEFTIIYEASAIFKDSRAFSSKDSRVT